MPGYIEGYKSQKLFYLENGSWQTAPTITRDGQIVYQTIYQKELVFSLASTIMN